MKIYYPVSMHCIAYCIAAMQAMQCDALICFRVNHYTQSNHDSKFNFQTEARHLAKENTFNTNFGGGSDRPLVVGEVYKRIL